LKFQEIEERNFISSVIKRRKKIYQRLQSDIEREEAAQNNIKKKLENDSQLYFQKITSNETQRRELMSTAREEKSASLEVPFCHVPFINNHCRENGFEFFEVLILKEVLGQHNQKVDNYFEMYLHL
jgi:hypothetical protein